MCGAKSQDRGTGKTPETHTAYKMTTTPGKSKPTRIKKTQANEQLYMQDNGQDIIKVHFSYVC